MFFIRIEKRNLLIIWISTFLVAASMTMVLPFISLYISTFGDFSDEYVQRWAGFIFGITFLTAFFFSPIWGRVGDRYGFKPILVFTGLGISICILLMGFIQNVLGLFLLRFVMGIVTGFVPTSIALISKQTSKEEAGKVLGTLQMGPVSGTLFGPLIGGMMADTFGFQYTFLITSFSIVFAALLVLFGIVEKSPTAKEKTKTPHTRKDVIKLIFNHRMLFSIMIIALISQVANFSVQPVLALYVSDLTPTSSNIAFLSGMAFSATGFGSLLLTRSWGRLGDEIGNERVLMILLVLAAILIVPQAFVTKLWQLILLRFLFGMAIGGMIPCIAAFIRLEAPLEMQGEVLGYNQSFRFLGNVIGPAIGGIVAAQIGISTVFYVNGILFLFAFGMLWWSKKQEEEKVKELYY